MLDVLSDRKKETLVHWLQEPPAGIDLQGLESVATDLWQQYRLAVQEVFPGVALVADRFHVVQNLHQAIHRIRREAQKTASSEEERKQLKGLRYLLLKNEQHLTATEKERLAQLAVSHPTLYRVWRLRQRLHDWYETQTTTEQARRMLETWVAETRQLGLKPLDAFCQTLMHWQTEIVNFFRERITSGFVEGMNGKIRVLKRIAFGLPNFDHFRLRVLAFCG